GCTLFHMLSGGPPFTGASLAERVLKHMQAPPPDLRKLNPAVSENLQSICWRLMAKKPEQRYQKPADLLRDLGWPPDRAPPAAPAAADLLPPASPDFDIVANAKQMPAQTPAEDGPAAAPPRPRKKKTTPVPKSPASFSGRFTEELTTPREEPPKTAEDP